MPKRSSKQKDARELVCQVLDPVAPNAAPALPAEESKPEKKPCRCRSRTARRAQGREGSGREVNSRRAYGNRSQGSRETVGSMSVRLIPIRNVFQHTRKTSLDNVIREVKIGLQWRFVWVVLVVVPLITIQLSALANYLLPPLRRCCLHVCSGYFAYVPPKRCLDIAVSVSFGLIDPNRLAAVVPDVLLPKRGRNLPGISAWLGLSAGSTDLSLSPTPQVHE